MQKYDYINKDWIVSPAARLVYRAAAVVSLSLYPLVVIPFFYPFPPLLRPLLLLAILGAALNMIGMEYYLFRFDDSRAMTQMFWFCVMIFIPLGPALYCFMVYSRSNAVKTAPPGLAGKPYESENPWIQNRKAP